MAFTFNFEIDTSSCPAAVIFVIDEDGNRLDQLLTPFRIEANMWCSSKERPKNIYLKKYKNINIRLNNLRVAISTYLRDCLDSNQSYSRRKLTYIISKYSSIDCKVPEGSLLECIENYIVSRMHNISPSTYKRYRVFYNLLKKFEAFLGRHVYIPDVNATIIPHLLAFGENESYSKSTIYRTINFIRTVLNHLEKRGVRTFVYELEFVRENKETEMVTLSEEELLHINRINLPKALETARDWLLISCYTGQRVSDFMRFSTDMIKIAHGKKYIVFTQCKTKRKIHLPLHPVVQSVMINNGNCFPPKLSYKVFNENIKNIAKIAGCNALINIRKRLGYRGYVVNVPKWEAVTTHIGRRSFASNYYGKIPTPLLMEATGHRSELMFQKYINPIDVHRILLLNQYFEDTYKIALGS